MSYNDDVTAFAKVPVNSKFVVLVEKTFAEYVYLLFDVLRLLIPSCVAFLKVLRRPKYYPICLRIVDNLYAT